MADKTHIEWADATWNPVTGCSVVSPGCTNCYAMRLAGTRLKHEPSRAGLTRETKAGPVWTGEVRFNEQWLDQPLRWKRPRRIFVCAHGDLFAEAVPDKWIDRVFAVMALAPQHTFLVLTKRAARMRGYLSRPSMPGGIADAAISMPEALIGRVTAGNMQFALAMWPLPNVWLGVSVEDQARADERIPDLLATPAAKRFTSAEPLLGPIDLTRWLDPIGIRCPDVDPDSKYLLPTEISYIAQPSGEARPLCPKCGQLASLTGYDPGLDWVIAGGESGAGARPMHPDWARSMRDQCAAAGVPFFFKQWGAFKPCEYDGPHEPMSEHIWADGSAMLPVGKRAAGRLLDGREHSEFPG